MPATVNQYQYNKMKVILIEGEGGDIGPYHETLDRIGIIGRPEVEVIKLQQKN